MRTVRTKLLGFSLAVGCATTGTTPATAQYDDEAQQVLTAKVEQMFRDMDSGNFEALKATGNVPEVVVFDIDPENKPTTARGPEEFSRFIDSYAAMTQQGLKVSSSIHRIDCYAATNIGYCTVEFDQTMAMRGQTMGPFAFRGTIVAKKSENDWLWTHWHGSFREMPAPPTAAAPPAAPPTLIAPPAKASAAPPSIAGDTETHLKKTVDAFAGKWKYDATVTMPNAEPAKTKLTFDCSKTARGKSVVCAAKGNIPGSGPFEGTMMFGYDTWGKAVHLMAMTSDEEVHDHHCNWTDERTLGCAPLKAGMGGQPITEDVTFTVDGKKGSFKSVITMADGSKATFEGAGTRK